jgi:hypothetical protein
MRVWVLEELAPEGHTPTLGSAAMARNINLAHQAGALIHTDRTTEPGAAIITLTEQRVRMQPMVFDYVYREMMRINIHESMVAQIGDEAHARLNASSGCWALVEKGVLWGCETVEDGEGAGLRTGQMVFGEGREVNVEAELGKYMVPKKRVEGAEGNQMVDEIVQRGLEALDVLGGKEVELPVVEGVDDLGRLAERVGDGRSGLARLARPGEAVEAQAIEGPVVEDLEAIEKGESGLEADDIEDSGEEEPRSLTLVLGLE